MVGPRTVLTRSMNEAIKPGTSLTLRARAVFNRVGDEPAPEALECTPPTPPFARGKKTSGPQLSPLRREGKTNFPPLRRGGWEGASREAGDPFENRRSRTRLCNTSSKRERGDQARDQLELSHHGQRCANSSE